MYIVAFIFSCKNEKIKKTWSNLTISDKKYTLDSFIHGSGDFLSDKKKFNDSLCNHIKTFFPPEDIYPLEFIFSNISFLEHNFIGNSSIKNIEKGLLNVKFGVRHINYIEQCRLVSFSLDYEYHGNDIRIVDIKRSVSLCN